MSTVDKVAAQAQASERWWDDPTFQDNLVALILQDGPTLKSCGSLLSPEDFRPPKGTPDGRSRWMVAERALEFYERHREPLGKLARADILQYADQLSLGASHLGELKTYLDRILKLRPTAPDALVEKVVHFKGETLKAAALDEMIDLQAAGQLTDEKWNELSARALAAHNGHLETTPYLSTLETRIERRSNERHQARIPYTFIGPLDAMGHTVGPKQLGMVLAPYKRGKSLFLLWLAVAFARQRLNVLYCTLEDPKSVVEDRLDSIASNIPLKNLVARPIALRGRFERFRKMIRAQIDIYDGTEGGTTMARLESLVLARRDEGFPTDVLITDYDEEIVAAQKYKEKRFETDEVYRSYRRLCSKYNMIGWLAAQTQRDTRHLKILSGDKVAEDIGKMRKVTCGISMGKGDWTPDSIYLWVAAHKTARMEVGCEIVPDLASSMIYDEEATRKAARANAGTP